MGWLKKVRDAQDEVREVEAHMLKINGHARTTGLRVTDEEHDRLQQAAEAADRKLRDAIRGRS